MQEHNKLDSLRKFEERQCANSMRQSLNCKPSPLATTCKTAELPLNYYKYGTVLHIHWHSSLYCYRSLYVLPLRVQVRRTIRRSTNTDKVFARKSGYNQSKLSEVKLSSCEKAKTGLQSSKPYAKVKAIGFQFN